jgi:dipeptidyl aminopeptidase/acylaminoacyl peptidase
MPKTTKLLALLSLAACSTKPTAPSSYRGHGAGSLSAETLARYAPGELDPALKTKLEVRLDLRSPGMGMLSPDGKRLFFTWDVTGVRQVWRIDGPRSFPVQLTAGQDVTLLRDVTPDGRTLILSRDRAGEEYPGLYLLSVEGGALETIQHKTRVQTFFQLLEDDGAALWFSANDIDPASRALYRYDLKTKKAELKFSQHGQWSLVDRDARGRLLLEKATGALAREVYVWDPAVSKEPVGVIGVGENTEYDAQFGAAPGEILLLTNKLGEFRRLYRWMEGSKDLLPVTPDAKFDVASFSIDRPRTRILYSSNEAGYSRVAALDARSFKPLKVPAFADAEQVWTGSSTKNGRYTAFGVETARAPISSYVYDWSRGKLERWVLPSAPEVDTSTFSKATLESYPARDGTRIPMFVLRPERCKRPSSPCPVVVSFHGGPESQSTPGFNPLIELYLEAGFVYVEPNVRGSDGYGRSWLKSDDGPKRLQVVTDIEDAALHMRKAWAVDGVAPKIGVMGGSYGGYSALYAMTRFAGAYDAGVAIVGMSSLVSFLENTAPYRRALRISEYGDPVKDREALLELSPITHVAKAKAPLLIMQGANDPRVPAGEAVQMHETMKSRGLASELVLFGDEGHGVQKRANRVLLTGHALRFFQEHLR